MACKLLLIRHGETVDNVNRIMQGQTPGKLTENGINQARNLGAELSQKHIDAFVSSDLQRAVDTCVEVAAPHFQGDRHTALANIFQTPLLRERDWGSFTGRYIPDLKDAKWTPDIETTDAMRQRANAFLQLMRQRYDGKTVAAVGHGIINKAIQSVFFGKPMQDIEPMKNGEVRVLRCKKTMMPFLTSSFFMFSSLSLYNLYCLLRTIRHFHCLKIDAT